MSDQIPLDLVDTYPSFDDVLGEVGAPPVIRWAFDAMEWAENAIEEAKRRHPGRTRLLDRAFRALVPRADLFAGRGTEHMVRAHMDELLDRIGEDGPDADLGPATAAECCCVLAEISLNAPLKHRHHVAYLALFVEAFGEDQATELLGEEPVRRAQMDRDEHLVGEIIDEVREKVGDEDRQKAWREAVEAIQAEDAA